MDRGLPARGTWLQFSESLREPAAAVWEPAIRSTGHYPDGAGGHAAALFAELELLHRAGFSQKLSVRYTLCRQQGHSLAAIYRSQSFDLRPGSHRGEYRATPPVCRLQFGGRL